MSGEIDMDRVNRALGEMQAVLSGRYSLFEVAQACGVMLAECIGMATEDKARALTAAGETGLDIAKKIDAEWDRLQAVRRAVEATGRTMQ